MGHFAPFARATFEPSEQFGVHPPRFLHAVWSAEAIFEERIQGIKSSAIVTKFHVFHHRKIRKQIPALLKDGVSIAPVDLLVEPQSEMLAETVENFQKKSLLGGVFVEQSGLEVRQRSYFLQLFPPIRRQTLHQPGDDVILWSENVPFVYVRRIAINEVC